MKCGVRLCDGRANLKVAALSHARRLVLFGGRGGDGLERPTRVAEEVGRPRRHRGGEAEAFRTKRADMSGEAEVDWANSYCPQGCPGRGGSHAYQNRRCVEGILGR